MLQDDNNLAATAKVQVGMGSTVNFQSGSPVVGNIQGAGTINLGGIYQDTRLTLGGDNSSSAFYGSIAQTSTSGNSYTGVGSLTKAGSGTLLLAAASTYSGGTRLNAGTLVVGQRPQRLGPRFGSVLTLNGGTLAAGAGGRHDQRPGAGGRPRPYHRSGGNLVAGHTAP